MCRRILLLLAVCLLAFAGCTPAEPAAREDAFWGGISAPELRRLGIHKARQLVEGAVTEHEGLGTSWVSIGGTPLGITVVWPLQEGDSPFEPGDVITKVGEFQISMIEELMAVAQSLQPGAEVEITLHRTGRFDWPVMEELSEFPKRIVTVTVGE